MHRAVSHQTSAEIIYNRADAGKISHEIAQDKALTEFEKYSIKQDKLYKSDFDLLIEEIDK